MRIEDHGGVPFESGPAPLKRTDILQLPLNGGEPGELDLAGTLKKISTLLPKAPRAISDRALELRKDTSDLDNKVVRAWGQRL